ASHIAFDLTGLFLKFPLRLFDRALEFFDRIARQLAPFLLRGALGLLRFALHLVPNARFHDWSFRCDWCTRTERRRRRSRGARNSLVDPKPRQGGAACHPAAAVASAVRQPLGDKRL